MSSPRAASVPVFPLAGIVLFPGVSLPLHVFEPRYRTMLRDVLASDRRMALAVLAPGWERDYEASPPFSALGCLGRVVTAEWRPDDRYDIVLSGESRVRFGRIEREFPYRACRFEVLEDAPLDDDDPVAESGKVALREAATPLLPLGAEAWMAPPAMESAVTLRDLVNRLAFALRMSDDEKLALLAEDRVVERTRMLLEHLRRRRAGR